MFAVFADQKRSRTSPDLVPLMIDVLDAAGLDFALAPERTSGDEFQFLLSDSGSTLDALRLLVRDGRWHVGVGVGAVEEPLPKDVRESRGPALVAAREALEAAKSLTPSIVLRGPGEEAAEANGVLQLLAHVWEGRTDLGWEAVDAVEGGHDVTLSEAAPTLSISKQALSQRLQSANWRLERRSRPAVEAALGRADPLARRG